MQSIENTGRSFADILNTLCRVNQEGVLTVTDEKRKKAIYFHAKGVTLIGSTQRMKLGDMLLHTGKIAPRELERALLEQQKSDKLLGEIVVEQGLATPDEIEDLLASQIEDEICDLFFWENAQFSFEPGTWQPGNQEAEQNHVSLTFDVRRLLFRIADKISEWDQIRHQIPSFSAIFVMAQPNIDIETLGKSLSPQIIQRILNLLDGTNDVTDIIKQSQTSVLSILRILVILLNQNAIRYANFEELIQIAQDLGKKSKTPKQIRVLEQALRLRSNDEELLLQIAHAYENAGGSKKAAEYYCKLGDRYSVNDPKAAMKYFERAIAHAPGLCEPREKILLLCEALNDQAKEAIHSEILSKLYFQEKNWAKAELFCIKYSERYPHKLDFQQILAEAYLQLGKTEQAIQTYEQLAEAHDRANETPQQLETLQKIIELDPKRTDIYRQINRLQSHLKWGKYRTVIISSIVAGLFLVGFAVLILYYELAARDLYAQAQKLEAVDKVAAKDTYLTVAQKYSWSFIAEDAQQQAQAIEARLALTDKEEQIRQQERERMRLKEFEHIQNLIGAAKYQEARLLLKGYRSAYKEPQWQKKCDELELKIQQREQKKYNEDIQVQLKNAKEYQKQQQWDQALAIYEQLLNTEVKEIAEDGIAQTKLLQLAQLEKLTESTCTQATTDERLTNFKAALQGYEQVQTYVKQALALKNATHEQILNLSHLEELATQGKARIDDLNSKANQKLKQAYELEKQGKIAEAFYLTLDLLQEPKLGKTEAAAKATLPIQINSEPRGAIIKEFNGKTPMVIRVEPQKSQKVEITYPSFEKAIVEIGNRTTPIIEVVLQKKILWHYNTNGPIWGRVSPQNNSIVVTSRSGTIVSLGPKDGQVLWENKTQKGIGDIEGGATVFDGQVYVGSNDRHLRVFDLSSGQLEWEFISDGFIKSTPVIDQDYILFGTNSGTFYCFQRETKKLLWTYKQPGATFSITPAIWSNWVITGNNRGELKAFQLTDGKIMWQHKLDDMICTDLVVGDKSLYFGTSLGVVYCWDIEQNQVLWKNKLAGRIGSHVMIAQRLIYVGTTNGYFYCLSRQDGRMIWQEKLNAAIYSSPALADEMIYVGTMDNQFLIFDQEGNIFWKTVIGTKGIRSDIVITENCIYVSTEEGIVYAIAR